MRKPDAVPSMPKKVPMDVAVVLWWGGNQTADTAGGPAMAIGPARPFSACPTFISLQYSTFLQFMAWAYMTDIKKPSCLGTA